MAGSLDSVHPSMDVLWDVFDSLWTDPSMDGLLDGSGLDWEASCPTTSGHDSGPWTCNPASVMVVRPNH